MQQGLSSADRKSHIGGEGTLSVVFGAQKHPFYSVINFVSHSSLVYRAIAMGLGHWAPSRTSDLLVSRFVMKHQHYQVHKAGDTDSGLPRKTSEKMRDFDMLLTVWLYDLSAMLPARYDFSFPSAVAVGPLGPPAAWWISSFRVLISSRTESKTFATGKRPGGIDIVSCFRCLFFLGRSLRPSRVVRLAVGSSRARAIFS